MNDRPRARLSGVSGATSCISLRVCLRDALSPLTLARRGVLARSADAEILAAIRLEEIVAAVAKEKVITGAAVERVATGAAVERLAVGHAYRS